MGLIGSVSSSVVDAANMTTSGSFGHLRYATQISGSHISTLRVATLQVAEDLELGGDEFRVQSSGTSGTTGGTGAQGGTGAAGGTGGAGGTGAAGGTGGIGTQGPQGGAGATGGGGATGGTGSSGPQGGTGGIGTQ